MKLKRRSRLIGDVWIARWFDPGKRKEVEVSLNHMEVTSHAARRAWATTKSQTLARRKQDIAAGVVTPTTTPVAAALKDYFSAAANNGLQASTLRAYHEGADPFAAWCQKNGVLHIEELDRPLLAEFRDDFVKRKAKVPLTGTGVGRGKRAAGVAPRSANQVNKGLRALRTILTAIRRRDRLPLLDSDGIKDCLAYRRVARDLPRFLRSHDVRLLLEAALRHDAATYTSVRRGSARAPVQFHYEQMAGFVVTVLLTGARFEEIAKLRWNEVDLQEGQIRFGSDRTKTKFGRVVPLDVTPTLKTLLETLALRRGNRQFVFGGSFGMPRHTADRARKRMTSRFGAPAFTWHDLRRTCGTFLTCAPSIYAGAAAFLSAKRLGHSVVVAEKAYVGALNGIPADAKSLEAAMGVEALCLSVIGVPAVARRSG